MLPLKHAVVKTFIVVLVAILSFTLLVHGQNTPEGLAHIVIEIEGVANVEYLGGGVSRLSVGTLVRPEDVILVGTQDRVVILCADLQIDQITRSSRSSNCAATVSDPIWHSQGLAVIDRQRSTGYENIPYIISPRNTPLFEPNPTIRWNPIDEAETYDVSIFLQNGTLLWEETEISETVLPYPERHPYLRALDNAGNPLQYEIVITPRDSDGNPIATRIDPGIRDSIYVLPPDSRQLITVQLQNIQGSSWVDVSNDNMVIYSAAFYLYNEGLYADALEYLQSLIISVEDDANNISVSPALYLLIGDIFFDTHLPVEAIANYQRARELSNELGDISSEARALSRLGSLATGDDANNYYSQAASLYRDLGEDNLADNIEALMN